MSDLLIYKATVPFSPQLDYPRLCRLILTKNISAPQVVPIRPHPLGPTPSTGDPVNWNTDSG